MKFTPRFDYRNRVLSACEAVQFEIASRGDDLGAVEAATAQIDRLAEIVGDLVELLPPEQQVALLYRHGFTRVEDKP